MAKGKCTMRVKTQLKQWIRKRFEYKQPKLLKQKEVLVFVYKQGFLYLVLILITFIAGINYANNLILGFCFLISAILCISFYLTFKQLHALEVEIISPDIGRVDEVVSLKCIFKQQSKSPKYLYIQCADQVQTVFIENRQQSIELYFMADQRGLFQVPQLQLYSTYPLGLVRAWTYFSLQKEIWIAPKPQDFNHEYHQAIHSGQPDLDEFKELRNFKEGDSFQSISWKQAARGQGLYVKQFEDQQDAHKIVIDYEKMPSALHEEKLSLMMGLVDQCEQNQNLYQVILPQVQSKQSMGEKHYQHIKKLLAQA